MSISKQQQEDYIAETHQVKLMRMEKPEAEKDVDKDKVIEEEDYDYADVCETPTRPENQIRLGGCPPAPMKKERPTRSPTWTSHSVKRSLIGSV